MSLLRPLSALEVPQAARTPHKPTHSARKGRYNSLLWREDVKAYSPSPPDSLHPAFGPSGLPGRSRSAGAVRAASVEQSSRSGSCIKLGPLIPDGLEACLLYRREREPPFYEGLEGHRFIRFLEGA
jgi:hypothetical protein